MSYLRGVYHTKLILSLIYAIIKLSLDFFKKKILNFKMTIENIIFKMFFVLIAVRGGRGKFSIKCLN